MESIIGSNPRSAIVAFGKNINSDGGGRKTGAAAKAGEREENDRDEGKHRAEETSQRAAQDHRGDGRRCAGAAPA